MIVKSTSEDFEHIYEIINDAASAYQGVIPEDAWHDPYMTKEELAQQIEDGVEFWVYKEGNQILGVMGTQPKEDVTLIRHAYVRTEERKKGIGSKLLDFLCAMSKTPILIGTWADAKWAIAFYQKHGFRLLREQQKNSLLRKYWSVPIRQIETSVVLASATWNAN